MNTSTIRQEFLDFFQKKQHEIVNSAPVVLKNDPTLMFVNAGMNQFKDRFLGNDTEGSPRVADTQKCLRVSGKHNDLEDVGVDTYHHTLFEMLGNWSFGDYFKKEAISWAWEFMTEVMKLPKERLYTSYFEGDSGENLEMDTESRDLWLQFVPEDHIIKGNKKDNFWEMGETGPCGPCTEIHMDLRSDEEIAKIPGRDLVNEDHPQVIELWNLVFIQFNRKANGSIESLPQKHVDTGMGLERLARVMQGKSSNYDIDLFQPILKKTEQLSNKEYKGLDSKEDIAFRVIADHIRALAFTMADGQLPSNVGAGYVVRRILRRAVRYGYSFLGLNEPFLCQLFPLLVKEMGGHYTELQKNEVMVTQVIKEEEESFYRTLEKGIGRLDELTKTGGNALDGKTAFELYDTFGFPIDLTRLILQEKGWTVNEAEFEEQLEAQKARSRKATKQSFGDWLELGENQKVEFVGYDHHHAKSKVIKWRKVSENDKTLFHLVLSKTPFYPEGGGQVGDKGELILSTGKSIKISNTKKENDLIIHTTYDNINDLDLSGEIDAVINTDLREDTQRNHSATHLLHFALRKVLGTHVEQKGSLVNHKYLRFDFSHFKALTEEELLQVEKEVNDQVLSNISCNEYREISKDEAHEMGAMALFGEKYGDTVRAIKFGDSVELCGGTHVPSTGVIGTCKILSESGVASGVRRIEMLTGQAALEHFRTVETTLNGLTSLLKNKKNPIKALAALQSQQSELEKQLAKLKSTIAKQAEGELLKGTKTLDNGIQFLGAEVDLAPDSIKNLCFGWRKSEKNLVVVLGAKNKGKANLTVFISDDLIQDKSLKAGDIVKEVGPIIQGGGGGQPFFATAGGKAPEKLPEAIQAAETWLSQVVMA